MKKRTFRWGWLIAVFAMTAMACTCGALSQAQNAVQTAEALGTQAQQASTEFEGLATEFEESGFEETAEAIGTESGDDGNPDQSDVPADIPVYPENDTLFAFEGTVSFFTSASFQEVVNFYKQEMPNNGWAEADGSVEIEGSAVLNYQKDGKTATVTVNGAGSQTSVLVVTSGD
jgi:hypothetical protein